MKTTLISGASSTIGTAIAQKFLEYNHFLILLVRRKASKSRLTKDLAKYKGKFIIFQGNLLDKKFIQFLDKNITKVDNLINNAATRNQKYFTDINMKELNDVININFKSTFQVSQIIAKKMIKHKIQGNIISLSSQLGQLGAYNRTAYCMSKFALEGLTKSMSLDLSKYKIRVNTISPTKTIINNKKRKESTKLKFIKSKIPLKKFSTVQEIAGIAYFLTTEEAQSITGTTIATDGGWTAGR